MNELIYQQAVRADREHQAATEALSAIKDEFLAIEARIAETSVARSQVVADARAGSLDERTAALRLAMLEEDARDLQGLQIELTPRVATAEAQVDGTGRAVRAVTEALAVHESGVAAEALDCQIRELERKLLRALVERHRVSGKRGDSLWNLWSPSEGLRAAVTDYRLPQV